MTPVRAKSDKPASNPVNRTRQSGKQDGDFAVRFSQALGGRDRAWLARETGLSPSTLHDYSRGAAPSADRAFTIADALGVDPRWLITGQGGAPEGAGDNARDNGWVRLPHRSAPQGREVFSTPVPREWLRRAFGRSDDLWTTCMPSQSFPKVAREGDPIVCVDAEGLVEGGLYLVELGGDVVVRRVTATAAGPALTTADSFADSGGAAFEHGSGGTHIIGRILGALVKAI